MDIERANDFLRITASVLIESEDLLSKFSSKDPRDWDMKKQREAIDWFSWKSSKELNKLKSTIRKQLQAHRRRMKKLGGWEGIGEKDMDKNVYLGMMERILDNAIVKKRLRAKKR